jgi:hypothetical protein
MEIVASIRSATRSYRRRKRFVFSTILLLSFSVAATDIMFTLIHAVLLRPLPFSEPQRLAWLTSVRPDRDDAPFSLPDYRDLRNRGRTIEDLAAIARWSVILSGSGPAERLEGVRVSSNLFGILGIRAATGRVLIPADDEPDSRTLVISYSLWQTRFAANGNVVGYPITLDDKTYRIVGVLPQTFQLPVYKDAALFAPLAPEFHPWKDDRNSVSFLRLVARTKSGATVEQVEADMSGIARQLAQEFPDTNGRKVAVKVVPFQEQYTRNIRSSLSILCLTRN